MNEALKGETLFTLERTVEVGKLDELARALGTGTAAATSTMVPFFGPTVPGEELFIDRLAIDLSRALLGSLTYEWRRPFRAGEAVAIRVVVEDVYAKAGLQFAVVTSEFRDAVGDLIQSQQATFIERQED